MLINENCLNADVNASLLQEDIEKELSQRASRGRGPSQNIVVYFKPVSILCMKQLEMLILV